MSIIYSYPNINFRSFFSGLNTVNNSYSNSSIYPNSVGLVNYPNSCPNPVRFS